MFSSFWVVEAPTPTDMRQGRMFFVGDGSHRRTVLSTVKTAIVLTKRQIKNARGHQQGFVTSAFIMVILILQETIPDGKDLV